ncbi:TPA: hypothetical protein MCT39_003775 [Klebsiella pneumoniae]|nr:hypothetical protein [Klebsiella pneumoniae]
MSVMIPAGPDNKKARKRRAISMRVIAMSVMTENTLAGSGGLLRCGNNALMDWIMSPSSGQAIIWRTIQDSNLKPIA